MSIRIAAIGLTHNHIYSQVDCLLRAGATLVGFWSDEEGVAVPFAEKYPEAKRVADRLELLEDRSIHMILTSAIPAKRAEIALAAMRAGKDVMSDKPGMTTFEQLAEIKLVQQRTGRIFSVCYSEHFETRSTIKAGELVASGAIGKVVNTIGMGPHALNNNARAPYFFDRKQYGGILCDIASHQIEQFLFFTGAENASIVSASVGNRAHPEYPGLQDVGDIHLTTPDASGYIRVDWFTPAGLGTWGDGRLTILGTEGYIELRKYVDIAGRPGKDHLFLVDSKRTHHIDCSRQELPYGKQLIADVLNRTETAMPQARCYKAMELAISAQQVAERGTVWAQ